jgi:hypothetical protein
VGVKLISFVLYLDDILLKSNNLGLIHETKQFLSQNFKIKYLGETSYIIGFVSVLRFSSLSLLDQIGALFPY